MQSAAIFVDPTAIMFAKLLLSMLLGGIIGTERAILAHQFAGTRTFGLVALGATLFIVAGNFVNTAFLGVADIQPTFIAAAIVTGIGFLGGGLIVFRGDSLHGVTTAAGLWMTAAIGLTVGFGLYALSIFATLLVLILFTGMWYVENRFKRWFSVHVADSNSPTQSK